MTCFILYFTRSHNQEWRPPRVSILNMMGLSPCVDYGSWFYPDGIEKQIEMVMELMELKSISDISCLTWLLYK